MKRSKWMALVATVAILCTPVLVDADEGDDELTSKQQALNQDGVTAIDAGDYDEAISYLETSLELGERNVTHANLGRAYQLAGDCEQADEHFEKASDAPAVEQPTPDQIAGAIERYRRDMADDCPGYLEVECKPPEIELFIDGEGPDECHSDPRELMPGTYELRGEYDNQITETTVAVAALETSRVRLGLSDAQVAGPDDDLGPLEEPTSTSSSRGLALLAAGGLALAGGIVLDTVPSQAQNYEVNAINFVPVGLYATSASLSFFGIRSLRR